jgi:LysR family glycine cleavage system transcriptional activator
MRKLPPLKSLRAFEAAARLGSFIGAAEELHVTPSAISHRVRELETHLGTQLFHRIHRSIVLTDAGHKYSEEVALAFGRIEAASQDVSRRSKSDLLAVHVVPSLAAQWLMPRMSRFTALHPDIDLRLHASPERIDLADGPVDFDIRYGAVLRQAGVAVEPLPDEKIVALCSPRLLTGRGRIRQPEDLGRHMLIHSEVNLYSWRDWQRDHPSVALNLERGLRFDRSFMSISAAIDGLGVCLESRLLVERELASGALVMPLGDEGPLIHCHSLLYLEGRARLPKMRLFRDWLLRTLNDE